MSHGFLARMPDWPGERDTAESTRLHPEALAPLGFETLTAHYAHIVHSFERPPVLIGHAVGGLIAQRLLGANLARAAVAIAPVPFDGIPPSPASHRLWTAGGLTPTTDGSSVAGPVRSVGLGGAKPAGLSTAADSTVSLSAEEFRCLVANTVAPDEAIRLFAHHAIPAPGRLLADLGHAGGARRPRFGVDVGNTSRGPLLLISGQEDRMVPDAATRAVYKLYGDSTAATTLKQFADRGHSLTVDSGWRLIADHVLSWLIELGIRAETTIR